MNQELWNCELIFFWGGFPHTVFTKISLLQKYLWCSIVIKHKLVVHKYVMKCQLNIDSDVTSTIWVSPFRGGKTHDLH